MNDQQLDKKVRQDAARVKKDISALVEHSTTRINRYVDGVSQSTGKTKEELTARMEKGVSQLSKGIEKLTGGAKDSVVEAAAMVKKDVGHELRQYNATAQKVAAKVTGKRTSFFGKQTVRYTLVGVSLALAAVFLLGSFLKPMPPSQG